MSSFVYESIHLCCSLQSCLQAAHGSPWKVWEESISLVILERGRKRDTQRGEDRKRAQTVKLLPISYPGKVTYRKSNRVNERSSANQIAYLNHLGNIQQLIKHPVLRPQFHILSCTALTQAQVLQITMRDVIIANVSSQMYHQERWESCWISMVISGPVSIFDTTSLYLSLTHAHFYTYYSRVLPYKTLHSFSRGTA